MSMAATSEQAKERKRQLNLAAYAWYTSKGICPRCKTNYGEPGRVYCAPCYRKVLFRMELSDPDGTRKKRYLSDRRRMLKEQGMCVDCGRVKATEGKTRCNACQKKANESDRMYRIRQRIDREVEQARRNGREKES